MAQETPPGETTQPLSGWQAAASRLKEWPLSRKLALAGVAVVCLLFFGLLIVQGRSADYQLLYANLAENDAASVMNWLKGRKIPFQLKNNGKNIWVPAKIVHETRLDLASVGLPQGGGVGFEVFDKQNFALTDFVQKVNYTRALQGELARTISSLGPVESTRVHLALPEKRLFKDQEKPGTASVIVKLQPGRSLSESQVQGIVHLVAGSVADIGPEHVTVIDHSGKVLSRDNKESLPGELNPDMLAYQQQMEQRLETRAQSLLDKALGPKSSLVRVTAALDFARVEKTEETFDPEEPVIRSEQLHEEKAGSEVVGGIPGVQSNLQGPSPQTVAATPPSSKSSRTTNYEISKVVSRVINPVGSIKNISVAVLVADKTVAGKPGEAPKFEPRAGDELQSIENMIRGALGLDNKRGDSIKVVSMPFTEPGEGGGEASERNTLYEYLPVVKYALILVAGLLAYFLLIRPMVKTMREEVTQHYKTVEELEAEQAAAATAAGGEVVTDPVTLVREQAMLNPVPTAYVIKNWINEK
ncbi:MAG: flagellar M-ring protein FliF [Desulfobulbaceae bacterium A2]|nr:MAG: flagellar M-ring protein FliF [Desulfobulbaceae bacterium A2]